MPWGCDRTSCALRAASPGQTLQRVTPFCGSQCSRLHTDSQHGGMVRLTIFLCGLRRKEAGPILQTGDWSRKLRRRIWDIGGRSLHRHRGLSTTLPPSRTGVRLQPTPAAAATDQLYVLTRPTGARCELGLLPVVNIMETGACVIW